jgi:subtilisin family serine protease
MRPRSIAALAALALAALVAAGGVTAATADVDVSALRVDDATDSARLVKPRQFVLRLEGRSLAAEVAARGNLSKADQNAYLATVDGQQDAVSAAASAAGATEVARVAKALNAVVVQGGSRSQLNAIDGVATVKPLYDYELDLSETVPYIGASSVQASGVDGSGITVAVLDSGVDYTHFNLGGAGTGAAYAAAYGASTADPKNTTRDGLFPTAKVVEGYDFVGESWPNAALAPDPDPIDFEGHGTHVADIIAGNSTDGSHKGVAPGASILAVKVCSAVATSCSGVALLEGVDFAMDPNGDGDISDAVDVMNLSLGSSYGQKEDDLSQALIDATKAGVTVVASAGNSADKPYVLGSPSSAPEVISVAQTAVPSAKLYNIVSGPVTARGSLQAWSGALTSAITAPLAFDTGNANRSLGCSDANGTNPYNAGDHAGKILIMNRGVCAVSFKVANAKSAGALAAIVANNVAQAPGDLPPDFSYGGGDASIPGFTVVLTEGNSLKAQVPNNATIDPANFVSLVQSMVSSSSRGPSYSYQEVKPDIGAPGASLSAEVGTGTGETAFGGTSGAAPMVAGAAALMLDGRPNLNPLAVKSLMMNTAETNIDINPLTGLLAPITRIGGGEVRVDKAIASQSTAWNDGSASAGLSFGYQAVAASKSITKKVSIRNFGSGSRTYTISSAFRYADDAASGAVSISAPASVNVPGNATRRFDVTLTIDPSKLPTWVMNGGPQGGNGALLNAHEFDGYLTLDGGANNTVRLPWQVLPHRSASLATNVSRVDAGQSFTLANQSSVLAGGFDVFAHTGTSARMKKDELPMPGDNFAVVDLRSVGVRDAGGGFVQFAIDTFGKRSHPNYPAGFEVDVDIDNNGSFDRCIFNTENGGFAVSGQNAVAVSPVGCASTTSGSLFFFSDADLNSGNMIMTAPMSALGITSGTTFRFSIRTYDNYFTGFYTDAIENMVFTLNTPKWASSALNGSVAPSSSASIAVTSVAGGAAKSPSQIGFLLMYRDAAAHGGRDPGKKEAETVRVRR